MKPTRKNNSPDLSALAEDDKFMKSGLNTSKDVCQQMLYMLDKDGSGTLEYNEFKEFWLNYHTWLATYHIYSYGSKGISVLDLRLAINSIGYTINHDILHKLIDSYCPDGEFICRNNFLMCALQLKSINTASQISSNDLG
ncbi:calpain-A-like [Achroia grisella]|uniref:calpain-A-like n=1 Tax=Achroia grisella TaxID=688607 RepID=UPI0027D21E0B|nr:calpain-A-like [Achroia grisella]